MSSINFYWNFSTLPCLIAEDLRARIWGSKNWWIGEICLNFYEWGLFFTSNSYKKVVPNKANKTWENIWSSTFTPIFTRNRQLMEVPWNFLGWTLRCLLKIDSFISLFTYAYVNILNVLNFVIELKWFNISPGFW